MKTNFQLLFFIISVCCFSACKVDDAEKETYRTKHVIVVNDAVNSEAWKDTVLPDIPLYNESRDIKDSIWNVKQHLIFDFEIPDTTTKFNLYFNIRNSDNYPFNNLYVFIRTNFPDGKSDIDTVEFHLADKNGRWYGKNQSGAYDCRLVFKENARFRLAGKYHMEIDQAMHMEQLPGILNAGIRIERGKK